MRRAFDTCLNFLPVGQASDDIPLVKPDFVPSRLQISGEASCNRAICRAIADEDDTHGLMCPVSVLRCPEHCHCKRCKTQATRDGNLNTNIYAHSPELWLARLAANRVSL